jgi:hypothetical protein
MDSALEGPAVKFDNSTTEKIRSIAVEALWAVICSVLCAIRIYTRVYLIRRFTLGDCELTILSIYVYSKSFKDIGRDGLLTT